MLHKQKTRPEATFGTGFIFLVYSKLLTQVHALFFNPLAENWVLQIFNKANGVTPLFNLHTYKKWLRKKYTFEILEVGLNIV